jgi:glycosyltransferase involved in cell wall biosynthesis
VVCVSEEECAEAHRLGLRLAGKVRVVPNGVDTQWFAPRDRKQARQSLGLAAGPLAVCVGRLSEQKGQDLLLTAWTDIRHRVPGSHLALVGEGPWMDRLIAAAGDAVTFAGNSVDPRDWYAAADVVVVPSRWEGMALVPLEAGASARSVVITDVAGAREAVPASSGAVVRPEDAVGLAAAVAARLENPDLAATEGASARDHVSAHYSATASGENMQAVYDEILSGTSTGTASASR